MTTGFWSRASLVGDVGRGKTCRIEKRNCYKSGFVTVGVVVTVNSFKGKQNLCAEPLNPKIPLESGECVSSVPGHDQWAKLKFQNAKSKSQ